jgi:hypothetical protein
MRDMMTLRRGLDMVQLNGEQGTETPFAQPSVNNNKRFGNNSGSLFNNPTGQMSKSTLIRRPAQIFVDADSKK